MIKTIIVCSDAKTVTQVKAWMGLLPHDAYIEHYPSTHALQSSYTEKLVQTEQLVGLSQEQLSPEQEQSRARELAKSMPISLFFIDADLIESDEWFPEEFDRLVSLGHIDLQKPPKTVFLVFDHPEINSARFKHKLIDDLLIKPLDQQLFLQKTDLHLADRPNPQSSFLFRAQTSGTIDIGKEVSLEEISDFGISICNPKPMAEGLLSRFYCDLLGDDIESSRCFARAYVSVRHPVRTGSWLIRFSLFGLTQNQLNRLRQAVRSNAPPHFGQTAQRPARHQLLDKRRPKFRVAVIDPDQESVEQIRNTLEENFERVKTVGFASLTRMMARFSKAAELADQDASTASFVRSLPMVIPRDASPDVQAIPFGSIIILIHPTTSDFIGFATTEGASITPAGSVLGHTTDDWLSHRTQWMDWIYQPDHDDLDEFLGYVAAGNSGTTLVRLVTSENEIVYCELKAQLAEVPSGPSNTEESAIHHCIHLHVSQTDQHTWKEWTTKWMSQSDEGQPTDSSSSFLSGSPSSTFDSGPSLDELRFDLIIVEASLIRNSLDEWMSQLHSAMVKARLISKEDPLPKVMIMADEKSAASSDRFAHPAIDDFLFKPIDRKLLTDKVELSLPALSRTSPLTFSPFVAVKNLMGHLCKAVPMLEVSEFGLAVQNPTPFLPRIFMRGFSPLLGDQPNGVLLRSIGSVKNPNPDIKAHSCYFIFFGANEALYQRIRRWIREDYAQRKEGQL